MLFILCLVLTVACYFGQVRYAGRLRRHVDQWPLPDGDAGTTLQETFDEYERRGKRLAKNLSVMRAGYWTGVISGLLWLLWPGHEHFRAISTIWVLAAIVVSPRTDS
jgi:hypothetical protein